MSLAKVVRGGLWLYISGLSSLFLGYVYWIVASGFVSPSVVGAAAAITSMQSLFIEALSLGQPSALQRFIGLNKGRNDYQKLFTYFFTSLALNLLVNSLLVLVIFIASCLGFHAFNLSLLELSFVIILTFLGSWPSLFSSLFTSVLRTEVAALSRMTLSFSRLFIGVLLLYLSPNLFGIILPIIVATIMSDVLLLFYTAKLFKESKVEFRVQSSCLKDLLPAGFASWIPSTLTILGQSMGVLSIYGYVGSTETGLYYISFALASLVYNFPKSILELMFPVLSGMDDGRKRISSRIIGLSLALTAPMALALATYPQVLLSVLGPKYLEASNILAILALGAIVTPIVSGYGSYIYAIGKYVHVTLIGLATNLGMLVLYVLLIPPLGSTGVAIAYALGFLISLAAILPSAYNSGFRFNWSQYIKTMAISGLLTVSIYVLNVQWFIGAPIILLGSFLAYTRLHIISKTDVLELSQAFMSKERLSRIYTNVSPIIKFMFGE